MHMTALTANPFKSSSYSYHVHPEACYVSLRRHVSSGLCRDVGLKEARNSKTCEVAVCGLPLARNSRKHSVSGTRP